MPLPPQKTIAQYNTDFINAYVAVLNPTFGVTVAGIPTGDPILAIGGAVAPQAVYLQGLIYNLVSISRASTSTGTDLDSWLADFGFQRPQGSAALATIQFSTSNGLPAPATIPIPVGTTVLTGPIAVGPSTVPTNYSFSVSQTQLPGVSPQITAGQVSVTLNCLATAIGSIYNFIPATTSLNFQIPIAGVGNPVIVGNISGGVNSASDPQARLDFINYIQSLSSATKAAIITAIQGSSAGLVYGTNFTLADAASNGPTTPIGPIPLVPPGLIFVIVANQANLAGGFDQTSPTAEVVQSAVQVAEAFSLSVAVYDCAFYTLFYVLFHISVSSSACTAAGISTSQVSALAQSVVDDYVNNLGIGQPIVWSTLIQLLRNVNLVSATGLQISNIITDVNIINNNSQILPTEETDFSPLTSDVIYPGQSVAGGVYDAYGVIRTSYGLSSPPYTTTYDFILTVGP